MAAGHVLARLHGWGGHVAHHIAGLGFSPLILCSYLGHSLFAVIGVVDPLINNLNTGLILKEA